MGRAGSRHTSARVTAERWTESGSYAQARARRLAILADFFRSPSVVATFLLLMLLSWLTVSAVMTLRTGRHGAGHTAHRQDGHTQPTMPPTVRAITGAPRS
jgi:hypothetical protein